MGEVTAVAHISEPIRKMTLAIRKTALIEKSLYILPNMNWKAHVHIRNADAYHPTSATVWKWSVMEGAAVATMLVSNPPMIRTTQSERIVNQNLVPVG